MQKKSIEIQDTIGGSVKITRQGKNAWTVKQRNYGAEHDNNQNPAWLRIFNPGRKAKIKIVLQWASFAWMGYHKFGYVQQAGQYRVITGVIAPAATRYEFEIPAGESFFGAFPWFSNEDNIQFLREICAKNARCNLRSIGRTGDGRAINCLTITDAHSAAKKQNVVIIGREHGTEPSGSFGVIGTIKYLTSPRVPPALFKRYAFHLIPIANPDGVARGLKLTRPGPVKKYDVTAAGMISDDPTIRALRREVMALRPACLITHHCYLMAPVWIGVYDKPTGLRVVQELVPKKGYADINLAKLLSAPHTLRWHCHKHFRSTVVITELPWYGKLPADIEKTGENVLLAALQAHANK